ncbi:MAG: Hsp20/alpha crystallin family protein [Patescibacteria group bacterium]|nr:Hsp20/alpha crystallin family protein [Patescibacteria group bacterium]
MDQDDKKFFEELAGASSEEPKTIKISDEENEEGEEEEEEEEEAEEEEEEAVSKTPANKVRSIKPEEESIEKTDDISDEGEGQLTIDVYQNNKEIVIESTIAGVKPEDLDIAITNEKVTIRGKREKNEKIKDEDYFYQECYWGRFSREIILPQEIDADKAVASLKNGILMIHLPKMNHSTTKKLKIKFE